jgi:hypothetical protein
MKASRDKVVLEQLRKKVKQKRCACGDRLPEGAGRLPVFYWPIPDCFLSGNFNISRNSAVQGYFGGKIALSSYL